MKSQRWLLFAALVSAFVFAGIAGMASAASTVTINPSSILVNGTSTVTAAYTPTASQAIALTMSNAIGTFSNGSSTSGESITGSGTSTLSYTSANANASTLTATFTCTSAGTTTFTLSQGGSGTGTSNTLTCTQPSTVTLGATPVTVGQTTTVHGAFAQTSGQAVSLSTTAAIGTFIAGNSGTAESVSGVGGATISYTAASTATGSLTGTFQCNSAGTATFTLSLNGSQVQTSSTLTCGSAGSSTSTVSVSPSSAAIGSIATVTGSYTPGSGQAITLVANTAIGTFSTASTTNSDSIAGSGTIDLSFTSVSGTAATITASFLCSTAGTTSFTLTQGGVATGTSGSLTCGSTVGNGISVTPTTVYAGQTASVVVSYTPAIGQVAVLSSTYGLGYFQTGYSSTGEIVGGANTSALTYTTISATPATLSATFICSTAGTATFTFTLGGVTNASSTPVTCYGTSSYPYGTTGYPYDPYNTTGYPYGTAYPYGTSNVLPTTLGISTLTATANPASLTCNQPATITIYARNAAGSAASDGSQINLSTSGGSLAQTSISTLGGSASATLTPPSTTSAVTVSIVGGSGQTSVSIPVSCDQSSALTQYQTAPTTSAVSPAQPVYPPAIARGTIAPPNTGDAGLLDANN